MLSGEGTSLVPVPQDFSPSLEGGRSLGGGGWGKGTGRHVKPAFTTPHDSSSSVHTGTATNVCGVLQWLRHHQLAKFSALSPSYGTAVMSMWSVVDGNMVMKHVTVFGS